MGDTIGDNDGDGLNFDINLDRTGLLYMILSIMKNSSTNANI